MRLPTLGLLLLSMAGPLNAAERAMPLDLGPEGIVVEGDLGGFRQSLTSELTTKGVRVYTLRLEADEPVEPKPLTLKFDFPSVDIAGYWNSRQTLDKVNYYRSGFTSRASGAAPVLCYYSNALKNRITIAASDPLRTIEWSCGVKEEDVRFYGSLRLFTEKTPPLREYEIRVLVNTTDEPYHRALAGARRWWETDCGHTPAPVPDAGRRPMYSTWYNFHQNLDADTLVAECRLAKAIGCEAIIVDDGWQTNDSNRGYAYTGDWLPERLADMRGFVDRVHAEGMQVILWYSLPFVGEEADNHARFEGKYLYHWEGQRTHVLDPRYPEVRDFMITTYENALRDWDLDGFKLDFIGWFKAYGDTELTAEDGRDYASVAEATDRLMIDILARLRAINPDVLIEFRQPYVGPVMREYGNLFRGVDCPNNGAANRNEIANLRLLSGRAAVHSDMFIWRPEESAESAALQLLNVLFSVPQVSVRLGELSDDHTAMLKHWLGYWNANREVLLDGDFTPGNPGANYPSLTAVAGGVQITALYETPLAAAAAGDLGRIDLVNATGGEAVYLDLRRGLGRCRVTVTNARGEVIRRSESGFAAGIHRIDTPRSGLARIEVLSPAKPIADR